MPTEIAYVLTNLLRVLAGSLVFYYFLSRKNMNPVVCLLSGLIYFVGGITEAELVFPVYLGISFYAPVALLIVDLIIEKKSTYFLLVPLYVFVVVIYDYYIAYMLMALFMVYFIIKHHMYSNKFFLITKEFYISFIKTILLIILGLLISAFIMIPSLVYVLNESSRTDSTFDPSFIYFSTGSGDNVSISIRHYFTGWMTLFTPNVPFNLALVQPGDYIREHYSMYITTGGLIFLVYFFFTPGKENHRLKFWVLILNIMFLMPIFSMIFTVSKWAYTRWFFIVYMINIYAMAIGMNKFNFRIGKHNFVKIFPTIILILGLLSIVFIITYNPDIYIHYDVTDQYYYPILIGSLILISIYLLILISSFLFQIFKLERLIKISTSILVLVIFGEVIFAGIVDFSTVGSRNYMSNYSKMEAAYNELVDLGYDYQDGYRINMYTDAGRYTPNANIMFKMTNSSQFFQSFYNVPLNTYSSVIHGNYDTSWSRGAITDYSLLSGAMWNYKYIIADKDFEGVYLPEDYYELLKEDNVNKYYQLKNTFNFIIYDEVFTDTTYGNNLYNDMVLLKYGYVKNVYGNEEDYTKEEKRLAKNYDAVVKSGIKTTLYKDAYNDVVNSYTIKSKVIYNVVDEENNGYFRYDITDSSFDNIFDMDMIYVYPRSSNILKKEYIHMYIKNKIDEENDKYYPLHYNVLYNGYSKEGSRNELWVQYEKETNTKTVTLYGFNFDIYDDFVERQNQYKNRKFTIDGNKMNIKFTNSGESTKIIKTGFAYSDDFSVAGDYELVDIDGGFLGVIVKSDIKDVDINITYIPKYYSAGVKLTAIGSIIYFSLIIVMLGYDALKKKRIIR